jgi:DNA-directed RNA polymerase subunit A'
MAKDDTEETAEEPIVAVKADKKGTLQMPESAPKEVIPGLEGLETVKTEPAAKQDFSQIAFQQSIHKQVDSIVFGVLSPKFIKKMASAKIVTPELYDSEGYPVDGGLMDLRLGVIDPGLRCKTCGSRLKECIGHFGYIELARPIVHLKFIRVILTVLRGTCKECGRILIPKEKIAKSKELLDRIDKEEGLDSRRKAVHAIIEKLKTTAKCPHCNAKQEKIVIEKPTSFMEGERRLSPIEVRTRLEKVPDEDCEIFGLNTKSARPEWMILTVLAIPPVTMRPSITLETGERSEDDLTHKLGDVVRINQRLFENINAGAPEIIIEDLWDLLQYHVTTFFDNEVEQLPPARHRSGQPLKTLTERIKSKEGRIRHNLAGKRTNFCARTVISPDPRISINEVGVPKIMAMKLTIPEVVQPWNTEYLKKFIQRGPHIYPGANYVIRPDGRKKRITDETKEAAIEELQPGYVVERHLMDGDIAIFNRQPSLHRMSMMCHRVKVLPGRTLRLNPAVCAPYNADFDGDEMNLHIPQTEESRAEAEILMDVQTQIISPRYGLSIIGCIQDAISGNYLLTKNITKMPRHQAISLLISIGVTEFSRLPNKEEVSGNEVFATLLPEDFNFVGETKAHEPIVIKNGKITQGYMDEVTLGGEGSGFLLRNIHQRYGSQATIDILHKMFKLGAEVLMMTGFSSVISDTDLPQIAKEQVTTILDEAEAEVNALVASFNSGNIDAFPGRSRKETLELKILEVLNRTRNKAGAVVKENLNKSTDTAIMVASGARGNNLQLAQMAALVGQQALRGQRIHNGFRGRTLSCFKPGDLSPEAHGFIRSSFKKGLSPVEFFYGSITGRDSLMDTALRTPKSGYLYRRLANAMQDLKVEYDNTVRDATGKIVQFMYGEDGLDVSRTENGKIDVQRIIDTTE